MSEQQQTEPTQQTEHLSERPLLEASELHRLREERRNCVMVPRDGVREAVHTLTVVLHEEGRCVEHMRQWVQARFPLANTADKAYDEPRYQCAALIRAHEKTERALAALAAALATKGDEPNGSENRDGP